MLQLALKRSYLKRANLVIRLKFGFFFSTVLRRFYHVQSLMFFIRNFLVRFVRFVCSFYKSSSKQLSFFFFSFLFFFRRFFHIYYRIVFIFYKLKRFLVLLFAFRKKWFYVYRYSTRFFSEFIYEFLPNKVVNPRKKKRLYLFTNRRFSNYYYSLRYLLYILSGKYRFKQPNYFSVFFRKLRFRKMLFTHYNLRPETFIRHINRNNLSLITIGDFFNSINGNLNSFLNNLRVSFSYLNVQNDSFLKNNVHVYLNGSFTSQYLNILQYGDIISFNPFFSFFYKYFRFYNNLIFIYYILRFSFNTFSRKALKGLNTSSPVLNRSISLTYPLFSSNLFFRSFNFIKTLSSFSFHSKFFNFLNYYSITTSYPIFHSHKISFFNFAITPLFSKYFFSKSFVGSIKPFLIQPSDVDVLSLSSCMGSLISSLKVRSSFNSSMMSSSVNLKAHSKSRGYASYKSSKFFSLFTSLVCNAYTSYASNLNRFSNSMPISSSLPFRRRVFSFRRFPNFSKSFGNTSNLHYFRNFFKLIHQLSIRFRFRLKYLSFSFFKSRSFFRKFLFVIKSSLGLHTTQALRFLKSFVHVLKLVRTSRGKSRFKYLFNFFFFLFRRMISHSRAFFISPVSFGPSFFSRLRNDTSHTVKTFLRLHDISKSTTVPSTIHLTPASAKLSTRLKSNNSNMLFDSIILLFQFFSSSLLSNLNTPSFFFRSFRHSYASRLVSYFSYLVQSRRRFRSSLNLRTAFSSVPNMSRLCTSNIRASSLKVRLNFFSRLYYRLIKVLYLKFYYLNSVVPSTYTCTSYKLSNTVSNNYFFYNSLIDRSHSSYLVNSLTLFSLYGRGVNLFSFQFFNILNSSNLFFDHLYFRQHISWFDSLRFLLYLKHTLHSIFFSSNYYYSNQFGWFISLLKFNSSDIKSVHYMLTQGFTYNLYFFQHEFKSHRTLSLFNQSNISFKYLI